VFHEYPVLIGYFFNVLYRDRPYRSHLGLPSITGMGLFEPFPVSAALPKQIPQDNHLSDKQELFRLRVYGVGIREEDKPQEGKGEDIHDSGHFC